MNKMKIGVLTFHKCINYGSFWQALNLVRGINEMGHEARLLEHRSGRVQFSELKCALQPVLPTSVPASDRVLYRQKTEAFFDAFTALPLSAPFPLHHPELMETFDMVVVGSDEVWNLYHPWYANSPVFFGEGVQAPLLCAYAASFGNYPAASGLEQKWAERLRNFDMISVRDSNAFKLVQAAIGLDPETVLDPCLQFSPKPVACNLDHLPRKYIAVYGHNFETYFITHVKAYAQKHHLPLVSIGYRNDWADQQWITAGPHEFVHFMENSTAVATNFFHGCVFALQYNRPFACATTPYRSIKVTSLMEQLGGLNHLVAEHSEYPAFAQALQQPAADYVQHRITQMRQSSEAFLQRAFDLKQYQYA